MKHALLIIMIAAFLPVSVQAGEIYRWTDESGNTHFSEDPPSGVDATPMNVQTRSPESQSGDDTPEQSSEPERDNNAQGESDDDEAASEEEKDQAAIDRLRRRNCEKAKKALKTLEQNDRVQVEEDGERRYLSPEEKEAERERYEKARDENCD